MSHAFLITAYKDSEQLHQLVKALRGEGSVTYIHVDRKSGSLYAEVERVYASDISVKLITSAIKVNFGGFSHLKAILMLIYEALKNPAHKRFHLLSAQDYPIKSRAEIDRFFEDNCDKEYLTAFRLPDAQWENGGLDRIKYYHLNDVFDPKKRIFPRLNKRFVDLQKKMGLSRKQPTYIADFYGGGTWWSLSRRALDEIVFFCKKHPAYLSLFRNTHCGEEIFFHTILGNSALKTALVPEDLRYIDWSTRNGSCPAILDINDVDKICNSSKIFARKFETGISSDLRKEISRLALKQESVADK